MRISADSGDAGYGAFLKAKVDGAKIIVFLDGKRMPDGSRVLTADEGSGEIVKFVMDGERVVTDPSDPGTILTETLHGRVKIVRSYPAPESASRWARPVSRR